MQTWIRFLLGLPARPKDRRFLQRHFPEIFEEHFLELEQYNWDRVLWPIPDQFDSPGDFVRALIRWLDPDFQFRELPTGTAHPAGCPVEYCPLRDEPLEPEPGDDEKPQSEPTAWPLNLTMTGGQHRDSRRAFFSLVENHHKRKPVRTVTLTDPYIFSPTGEHGESGGYDNLLAYLKALGLDKESAFRLRLNPSPKRSSEKSVEILERTVTTAYPKSNVERFRGGLDFHDRLFLVHHTDNELRGIFGPSLNGLGGESIFVMGPIDDTNILNRLNDWIG